MSKVSILVPSRNERFLSQTIEDIFAKATGDIEVIVVLDGHTRHAVPAERQGLTFIKHPVALGKAVSINHAASIATGKYLMFLDAHCIVSLGFDEALQADCDEDWVVVARKFMLDSETYKLKNYVPFDYHYLAVNWGEPQLVIQCCPWIRRAMDRKNILIDETMGIAGSLTFMTARHFNEYLGGLETPIVGTDSVGDWLDVILKTWLGGGKVMVNKNVWYGHCNSPFSHGYVVNQNSHWQDYVRASRYWLENRWEQRIHDLDWLVDHFWPLPTAQTLASHWEKYTWPENWRELWKEWNDRTLQTR